MRITALLLVALLAELARADEPQFSPADVQFFEKHIRPLLAKHCYRCHATTAKRVRGGLRLDNRATILRGGDSGPTAVPKHPEKSLLIKAVRYGDVALQMPPKKKLPKQAVALLEEWVRRGVPFPETGAVVKKQGIDFEAGRRFWSFQPLRRQELPVVKRSGWVRKRADAFVLAKLEERGLAPAVRAKRRTLLRRVYFDLIGLPPSPAEVQAFVADDSPGAYAKVVERLLASPHYGERWARYWLDLARYCDIAESWAETKGAAWLYRDWVVRALNADMPYDRFVTLQLAADVMDDAESADKAALGFLGRSPSYWKELQLDHNVIKTVVAEEWEERIEAVSRTFLGLTVACARCHDHKFDPISTEDYYALAGVFASTKLVDRTLLEDAVGERVRAARRNVAAWQKQVLALKRKKTAAAKRQLAELQRKITEAKRTPYFGAPLVPAVTEASLFVMPDGPHRTKLVYKPGVARDVYVQRRGSPTNLGEMVPRRFLTVLSKEKPRRFSKGSGRLELAEAIVTEGVPLTARVIVNRIWKHHFGTGLVETPSNFGTQGERPSHPRLLDDLAARFVAHGWSLKWLHREILLSATYQSASSARNVNGAVVDPENRLYGRMNRRRLDVEAWRDAMLCVTGELDRRIGGGPRWLHDPANHRRTLYGTIKRREISDILRLHDFPDPTNHSPNRVPTTTPLQQLFTLNSPFVQQRAAALVRRLQREVPSGTAARVRRAYQLVYGRAPTTRQLRWAIEFLGNENSASDALWQQYAQVLLGSNEFLFLD